MTAPQAAVVTETRHPLRDPAALQRTAAAVHRSRRLKRTDPAYPADLLTRLQRSHGNAYVRRALEARRRSRDPVAAGAVLRRRIVGRTPEPRVQRGLWGRIKKTAKKAVKKVGGAAKKVGGALKKGASALLKAAFTKALKMAGVDASKVWKLLGQAGKAIFKIFKHPGRFLKTLIKAVGQGFRQFRDNVGKHLKAGLMEWLFGTMSKAGIQLPKDFSPKSILMLVLQVLGITKDKIREKLRTALGKKADAKKSSPLGEAMETGEKTADRFTKAWEFLSSKMRDGVGGLWPMLQAYVGNLKKLVIDRIRKWVKTRIIKAAIMKVVTMFNPVSGLITIIKTIYQVIKFLIQRAKQIAALFRAVAGSVAALAKGIVKQAADRIENALARLIPVVIGFLASLLGIGGLAGKIKSVIGEIRKKVDKGLDQIIAKVAVTFSGPGVTKE